MIHPVIQVAGISSLDEALLIARAGASHLGFPFKLDFNHEDTTEGEAARIIRNLPPSVKAVLITYLDKAPEIAALMKKLGCNIVQLHGKVSKEQILELRIRLPEAEVWKSLVINPNKPEASFQILQELDDYVDAFITDTFDPVSGASGATGKTHDWDISRRIVSMSKRPVIIAGGLNPLNVRQAIKSTLPAGVDVHTGVEGIDGLKSIDLVGAFVHNARKAFAKIYP